MLREPGCELVELLDRERPTTTRRVPHRFDAEDRVVDALTSRRFTSRALEAAVSRLRRKGVPLINIWGVGWLLPEDVLE